MIADTNELAPIRLRDAKGGEFLSVRSVEAESHVYGPFCRTRIDITFSNDLDRTLEGDLVFPLPPSAALRELSVKVGGRSIEGKIRPRKRAQAEYARALEAGQTAALGETEGEDLARLRVAPIEKGEDVAIRLVLAHTLLPTDSGHRLLLPLTYMPRFVEDAAALKPTEHAAVDRPRPLTSAARASVRVTIRHGATGAPAIRCTSHATETKSEGSSTLVTLSGAPLDRDLHLEIQDRPQGSEPALWIVHDPSDGPDALGPTTAVAIVPPAFADEGPTVPRTVTFLVDRSGSMGGGPMQSAIRAVRGTLRALTPDDRFNIIAFDDSLVVLASRPIPFDDAGLAAADAFISGIDARGGTNASMAIAAALSPVQIKNPVRSQIESIAIPDVAPPAAGHRLGIVVFMTDGDVAGAEQVLRTAQDKLVDTRVFVLGIGHSVNHAMLSQLASAGGGTYLPVATEEDLEQTLVRFKNAINSPLWTSVNVLLDHEGERRPAKQLEPPPPLDLFGGQPLLLGFRGPLRAGERLVLEGQRPDGEDRRMIVPVGTPETSDEASAETARVTWALLRNRRLTYRFDKDDDATLEGLGATFGITNRMVALVGVDPTQRDATIEGSVPVSLPMPGNVQEGYASMVTAYGGIASMPAGAPPMLGAPPPAPPPAQAGPRAYAMDMMEMEEEADDAPAPPSARKRAVPPAAKLMAPAPAKPALSPSPSMPARPAPTMPALTNDEAGLRALILQQGANGLFSGDLGVTLAAIAALVANGHTHREGLFRAELRRTVQTLRARLGTASGDERVLAAIGLAMLTIPAGDPAPAELPDELAKALAGLSLANLAATKVAITAALALAPASLASHAGASAILQAFQLR